MSESTTPRHNDRIAPRRDPPPYWRGRPNTLDLWIFEEVVARNQYGLPASFDPRAVVVDVGAHVGSFSWTCFDRGAHRVFAYEVEGANFEYLRDNLATHEGSFAAHNVAVWRSDAVDEPLFYEHYLASDNTGAVHVGKHGGQPVPAVVRFDEVIRQAARGSTDGRVRLAKLDVEGSEFPILYTATALDLVDELVGECHPHTPSTNGSSSLPPYTMDCLRRHLQQWGFRVSWWPESPKQPETGIFRAER